MPMVPFMPCLTIWFNFLLIVSLDGFIWSFVGIYFAAGVLVYFCYGYRYSKLQVDLDGAAREKLLLSD